MGSKENQALVSMVIPSFNHERYVKACIESVIAQDYPCMELIVIDDGSTDGSVKEIEGMVPACLARFMRFEFRSRANKGLAATLNEAIEWASGTYFAAVASDDILHRNKTSDLLAYIEHAEDVAGVFSGCEFIDQGGSVVSRLSPLPAYHTFDDVVTRKHVIVAPSQLLRLRLLKEVGGYPIGIYIEDWYMWLALTSHGYKLRVVPDQLVQYRQHESNISKNGSKMFESRKLILEVFKDHPLYDFAMAQVHTMAAIDFSCSSKKRSAKHLGYAFVHSKNIVFTRAFNSGLVRLFLPCLLVKTLGRFKRWIKWKASKRWQAQDHSGNPV